MNLLLMRRRGPVRASEPPRPEIALGTFVDRLEKTSEGFLIAALHTPWHELIARCAKDPSFLHQVTPEQLEEIVAASYDRAGFTVQLTPRSGDRGRDVIAEKPGLIRIRILEQVKRYGPGHLVDADDVRSFGFVLGNDRAASKGYVTTTSDFAPGVYTEFKEYMPSRLELRNGEQLRQWLNSVDSLSESRL